MDPSPDPPELVSVRVAESADELAIIFEQCGLRHLDTFQRLCRLWRDLARAMPTRWATAYIAALLDTTSWRMIAQFAVRFRSPNGLGLAVADATLNCIVWFGLTDLEVPPHEGAPHGAPCRGYIGQASGVSQPHGLATDGTHLFVVDGARDRVLQVRLDGVCVDSIGGKEGSDDGQLNCAWGLALVLGGGDGGSGDGTAPGNSDRLFVADRLNHRICIFGVSPLRFQTAYGHEGSAPLEFCLPTGLAVHASCLFVSDAGNHRIQVLTLGGRFLRSCDLAYTPGVIAVRPDGRLLVSVGDKMGRRVELMTPFGSLLQVRSSHAIRSA